MFKIVIDGGGDMPRGWAEEFEFQVIPINIHFKGVTYRQGADLTDEDFYRTCDASPEIPKTSQPTPQQFIDLYKKIANLGDTILSLHISSKLSGTFESAVLAARELVGQYHIIPFDTLSGSAALAYMAREVRLMDRAGESLQQILQRLEFIRRNIQIVLTLDTMEYARKSGRVKALQAAVASILNVKPILTVREGVILMGEKVRTRRRSLERIIEIMSERFGNREVNVAVVAARDPDVIQVLLEKVRQSLNCCEVIVTDLSIGVAANLGPGTAGLIAYPVKE